MEESRIGVFICWCGSNIAKMVDVNYLTDEIKQMPQVVVCKNYKYMCSDPGQDMLISEIKKNKLNRVVVAACSPRIHELTFRRALEKAGVNPYLLQMANIREQVSWVHDNKAEATAKARSLISAAVKRVNYHEPLQKRIVEVNPATLVIGGGIAGLTAAVELADAGKQVYLLEKEPRLGGNALDVNLSYPFMSDVCQLVRNMVLKIERHPNIEVFLNTTLGEIFGYIGNFQLEVHDDGDSKKIEFGNIIVATGLKAFNPSGIEAYGYNQYREVITSLEFEKIMADGGLKDSSGKFPENIAIIHCVGSRIKDYHEYCSRICCNTALKFIDQIKEVNREINIYDLYTDMRAQGKGCEELYTRSGSGNTLFLLFDQKESIPKITRNTLNGNSKLIIRFKEQLSGEEISVPADLVILMVAAESREDAKDVAHKTGISLCGNEFFIEKHPKLDPVATSTDGVYLAGACQGPKDINESMTQARAAVSRILATIIRGTVEVEVTTAHTNEDICCGCQTCINVCPYHAIHFDEEKNVSVVNEILCKGCGTCGSACPTGAISTRHFTDIQILSQIEGLMDIKESSELKEMQP